MCPDVSAGVVGCSWNVTDSSAANCIGITLGTPEGGKTVRSPCLSLLAPIGPRGGRERKREKGGKVDETAAVAIGDGGGRKRGENRTGVWERGRSRKGAG